MVVFEKARRCWVKWHIRRNIARCDFHALLCAPTGQLLASGDETRTVRECEVRPRPLEENSDTIAEANQKVDVNGQPREPGHEAAPMCFEGPFDFCDCGEAANRGHVALVEITERLARLAFQVLSNHARHVCAHLHRRLSDTRDLPAILLD